MKNIFEAGIWPGSKVEKDKPKEVKMEDFDNFREYLKAKVRKERADAKEALEKGIMGMSQYSGWVERVEDIFLENEENTDPEEFFKELEKEGHRWISKDFEDGFRNEVIEMARQKFIKYKEKFLKRKENKEADVLENVVLGGDIKYNQRESILPGGHGDVIYNPETPRFAERSTMSDMIDLYLKQGWDLKVITDREENAIVTGREGDKIVIKLEDGKEVRVNIDSIITLEEYNKNKINLEKQGEVDKKRQEEIEANKEVIIDQAIDFYKENPIEYWGGGMFFYHLSVDGYGQVKPISRNGKNVTVRFGLGKDEKTKEFSIDKIQIKDEIRIS